MAELTLKEARSEVAVRCGDASMTDQRIELYNRMINRAQDYIYLSLKDISVVGDTFIKQEKNSLDAGEHASPTDSVWFGSGSPDGFDDVAEIISVQIDYGFSGSLSSEVVATPLPYQVWQAVVEGTNSLYSPSEEHPIAAKGAYTSGATNYPAIYINPSLTPGPAGDYVRIMYYKKPDELTSDTDTISLDTTLHGVVADLATSFMLRYFPDRYKEADELKTAYDRYTENLRNTYGVSQYVKKVRMWDAK